MFFDAMGDLKGALEWLFGGFVSFWSWVLGI
jgi:hypothetical protein